MPPPPAARAKVLHAYAELLVESGERSATLDAVAERAGVSKGGLLYHFPSKEALAAGLMTHLTELTTADVTAMRADPAGAVDYLLRTSTVIEGEFGLIYLAVTRLAQGPVPQAAATLEAAHTAWTQAVHDEVGDPVVARATMLLGEGLYALAAVGSGTGTAGGSSEVDDLVALVAQMARTRRATPTAG